MSQRIDRFDTLFSRMLDIPGREKTPTSVSDELVPIVPIFGTTPLNELLLDTVTGAAAAGDVELTTVPDGKVRIAIAVSASHTEAGANRWMTIGLRWERAGVTSSVALMNSVQAGSSVEIALEDLGRAYLGPAARFYATALSLGGAGQIVLKMAYVERTLGETFPP